MKPSTVIVIVALILAAGLAINGFDCRSPLVPHVPDAINPHAKVNERCPCGCPRCPCKPRIFRGESLPDGSFTEPLEGGGEFRGMSVEEFKRFQEELKRSMDPTDRGPNKQTSNPLPNHRSSS